MTDYLTISRGKHAEICQKLTAALNLLDQVMILNEDENLWKVRELISLSSDALVAIDPNF